MGKCRLWVNVALGPMRHLPMMGICRPWWVYVAMGICRMGICRLTAFPFWNVYWQNREDMLPYHRGKKGLLWCFYSGSFCFGILVLGSGAFIGPWFWYPGSWCFCKMPLTLLGFYELYFSWCLKPSVPLCLISWPVQLNWSRKCPPKKHSELNDEHSIINVTCRLRGTFSCAF